MSKIYLPYAEQFDLMNENLAKIANAIGSDIDISTWAGVQKAVRVGIAPDLIPVGTQLTVGHSVYGDMLYDVVAHNHYKSSHDKRAHTMTLMCHGAYPTMMVDAREAFYYAETALSAGTYNFKIATSYNSWSAGTYQFTLTQSLPQGGQLAISDNADVALTSRTISAYSSATSTVPTETVAITSGSEGTSLGTFGETLNHIHRVAFGSDNYKESAIRQFLNSSAEAGGVWIPQTKFDRPPSWVSSTIGFMNGLDEELLNIIGEVVVPCSANNTYESPDSSVTKGDKYTINDKFYLASQMEVFGKATDAVVDDSILFSYYESATNTDYVKYRDGAAANWWLRSTPSWDANTVKLVTTGGGLQVSGACNLIGFAPCFTIV